MHANALKRPAEADLVTVCLVPFGAWQGHPMGAETYGPEEGAAIVAYFKAAYESVGKPMPIDYDHASLHTAGAPAAGWCWSVEIAEYSDEQGNKVPGVWGQVEWTDKARTGIEAKEYSGAISPVIDMNFPDPVSGEIIPIGLFNAALTNMPFMLDKMPQAPANTRVLTNGRTYIYSRHTNGGTMDPNELLAKIVSALGLPAETGWDAIEGLAKKFKELASLFPTAGGMPATPAEMPEMETAMQTAVSNSKILSDVAALLKVNSADVLAKVGELTAANSTAPTRAELDAVKKELAERKADELIANNLTKIKPDDRAFWKERATSDYDGTVAVFAKMPNVIPANNQEPTRHNNAVEVPDEVRDHYRDVLGTKHLYNKEAK